MRNVSNVFLETFRFFISFYFRKRVNFSAKNDDIPNGVESFFMEKVKFYF